MVVGVVDYAEVDLVLEDLDVGDLLCTERILDGLPETVGVVLLGFLNQRVANRLVGDCAANLVDFLVPSVVVLEEGVGERRPVEELLNVSEENPLTVLPFADSLVARVANATLGVPVAPDVVVQLIRREVRAEKFEILVVKL